jgi:acyl-ACP thioesterase
VTAKDPHTCSVEFRVRFDEAGPDGLLRTSSLLRYAQDLASVHSAERGFDRSWYAERGLAWLARTASAAILAPIAHGSSMTGTTRVVGERRVWARRRTDFHDRIGRLVARTHVDWVLLDAHGAPTRVPPEFGTAFETPRATFRLGRVELGSPPAEARTFVFAVRPQELDPMDHVNNAVYVDWLEEAILGDGGADAVRRIPRLARLEYARSAEPAAALSATVWPDEGGDWSYRLRDGTGNELLRARLERTDEGSPD